MSIWYNPSLSDWFNVNNTLPDTVKCITFLHSFQGRENLAYHSINTRGNEEVDAC